MLTKIVLSRSEIGKEVYLNGWSPSTLEFILGQMLFAMMISAAAVVIEYTLRNQYLAAEIGQSDSESLVAGFRRMLRGICDGDLLLDNALQVQDSKSCLNRLLSTSEDLKGVAFKDLLVQDGDEQQRFRDFIAKQPYTDIQVESTPQCLRVSLQSSFTARIGVDLYHVSLPHLYGCNEAYHLFAARERSRSFFFFSQG